MLVTMRALVASSSSLSSELVKCFVEQIAIHTCFRRHRFCRTTTTDDSLDDIDSSTCDRSDRSDRSNDNPSSLASPTLISTTRSSLSISKLYSINSGNMTPVPRWKVLSNRSYIVAAQTNDNNGEEKPARKPCFDLCSKTKSVKIKARAINRTGRGVSRGGVRTLNIAW